MMKTCRTLLQHVRKLARKGQNAYPTITDLVLTTGLSFDEVIAACSQLVKDGYFEYLYQVTRDGPSNTVGGIQMTLKDMKPWENTINSVLSYIKKNWIAILALLISILSLANQWRRTDTSNAKTDTTSAIFETIGCSDMLSITLDHT